VALALDVVLVLVVAAGAASVSPAGAEPGGREAAIQLARQTLARERGLEASEVSVREAAPAEWADTSLGCPQKGMVYQPVLTSGWKVTLAVGERVDEVHVAGAQAVVCPGSGDEVKPAPGRESKAGPPPTVLELVQKARADLERRLGEEARRARLVAVRRTTWPDTSLGCPRPDGVYAQVRTDGYRLELELDARRYVYHSDLRHVVWCPESTGD
jgi:hypothetical protein